MVPKQRLNELYASFLFSRENTIFRLEMLNFIDTFIHKFRALMNLDLIDTGFFHADGGAMFGAIPKMAWRRRYPSDDDNTCVLTMRVALVRTDSGRLVLIDNGAGEKQLDRLGYYRFFDLVDLGQALADRGIQAEEITDVVLTHLHFDHCGYTTRREGERLVMAFPNATHWVSRRQWENFLHPSPLEAESYFLENMAAVEANGQLRLIDGETRIDPQVTLRLFDGHTPGQIVAYIRGKSRAYLFAGDVIPLMASLSPAWISAYDLHAARSYDEKVRLMREAAREGQAIIFCHDAYHVGATIRESGASFRREMELSDKSIND